MTDGVSEAEIKRFSAEQAITVGEARRQLQIRQQQLQQQQQLAEQQVSLQPTQAEIDKARERAEFLEASGLASRALAGKRIILFGKPSGVIKKFEEIMNRAGKAEEARRFGEELRMEAIRTGKITLTERQPEKLEVSPAGVEVVPVRDERLIGVVKEAPKLSFIESALGFGKALVREPIETIKGFPEFFERRVAEPGLEAAERIIRRGVEPVVEPFITAIKRAGEVEAAVGKRELFGGRTELFGFEERGTAIVTGAVPLTEIELAKLPFGGGEKEIIRRTQETIRSIERQEASRIRKKQGDMVAELEKKVEEGTLTVEEANKQIIELSDTLQKEFEQSFIDRAGTLATETEEFLLESARKRRIGEAVLLAAPTFALGLGFGAGAALLPTAIGTTGGIFFGVSAALQTPELIKELREAPLQTAGSLLISGAAFGAGAVIGGRVVGKPIENARIREALDRATTRQAFKQENVDFGGVIKRYALNPGEQARLKVLLDKGVGARIVETELVALTSTDAKILPKIRSAVVDILSADGRVVERISIGKFVVKQKGKIFTRDVIAESIGKVDKGRGEFATTVLEGKFKGTKGAKFKTIKETRLLEEFELGEIKKVSEIERLISGESRTRVVTERPIREIGSATELLAGRRLITRKPSLAGVEEVLRLQRKQAKPVSSVSDIILKEKVIEFRGEIKPFGVESIFGRASFGEIGAFGRRVKVSGIALSRKIAPKIKGRTLKTPTRFEITKAARESIVSPDAPPVRSKLEQSGLTRTILNINKAVPTLDVVNLLTSFAKEVAIVKPRVRGFLVTLLGTGKREKIDVSTKAALSTSQIEEQQEEVAQTLGQFTTGVLASSAIEETRAGERQLLSPITITTPQLQQRLQERPVSVTPFAPVAPIPLQPITPRALMIDLIREQARKKKVLGYHGFAKQGKEFVRVTEKPTSKLNAFSRAARVVDNSSSRQLKVTKIKKKIKKPKKRDLYALDNINKFRFFKQVKGKRVSLGNKAIEKTQFAIDTKGERQQITAKGILARMRKARMPKSRTPRRVPRRAKIRNLLGF